MNRTQDSFAGKPRLSVKDNSMIKNPMDGIVIDDEIHKFPESIRKSMKLGKHRKSYRISNTDPKARLLPCENDKLKIDIKSYDTHATVDHSSVVQFTPKQQDIPTFHYPEKVMSTTDRMFYQRKKLSPLKKNVKKEEPTKTIKITFLNIEKLQLVQMYNSPQKGRKAKQDEESRYYLNQQKPKAMSRLEQHESTVSSLSRPTRQEQKFKTSLKFKPFVAPFQRYYYKDFLWKVAFSNNLLFECIPEYPQKLKAFIGKGNNSSLIISLLKRRSAWWSFTDKYQEANLVWTQIKVYDYFKLQKMSEMPSSLILDNSPKRLTYDNHNKILNSHDKALWDKYYHKHRGIENKMGEEMKRRNTFLTKEGMEATDKSVRIQNHLPNNYIIGNKKALFYTMSKYYEASGENVFDYLPLTFHIQHGLEDSQYLKFLNYFYEKAKKIRKCETENPEQRRVENIWIVKPGEFTNRGNGINVCLNLDDIKKILKRKEKHENGNLKTYILQAYLDRPFLYQKRKFDIRHYMMISCVNGRMKGYWYREGYIRTTSAEYTVKTAFSSVHLTNDAVQKYLPDYGKYQKANKVSYQDFQKYLNKEYNKRYDFFQDVYPIMRKIATDTIRASVLTLDSNRLKHNFEVFGLDFMIDQDFKPWLIEVNNNPCLELACPLPAEIIPSMIENTLKICVDSIVAPTSTFFQKRPYFSDDCLSKNKFEMVYDSVTEQAELEKLFCGGQSPLLDQAQLQKEQDEVFEDEGSQLDY